MAPSDDKTENDNAGRAKAAADATRAAADASKARRQSEGAQAPIIPDSCNLGIVLRVVVPLLALGVLAAIATSAGPGQAVWRLADIGAVLVPAVLLSLALLCAARKVVNGRSFNIQWLVGCGLPATVTLLVTLAVRQAGEPEPDAAPLAWALATHASIAAAAAWIFIEYFRLRARAYSPSFSEARLQALQARIRPHFLFNSLNTVLGLMRSDPRRAEATLENLADLFRVFMRDARELVPLDDEVVTCKEYLAIEQLRIGDRLRVAWNLDEMPGDALLPSLLLQPLIENAVHHGIEPHTEPGLVEITVGRVGERVKVEIVNPISPTPPVRPGNQMALSNVRERLMLLYDMEAELRSGADGDRFRLQLEFPYRKERRRRDVRRYFDPDR
jgi:two-component system, LytTR family, sensor histidine kinase AlgZ